MFRHSSYLRLWRPLPPLFRLLLREPARATAAGISVEAEPEAADDLEPARDDIMDLGLELDSYLLWSFTGMG